LLPPRVVDTIERTREQLWRLLLQLLGRPGAPRGLRLTRLALAVLGACRSLGPITDRVQGPMNLARAFLQAGIGHVLLAWFESNHFLATQTGQLNAEPALVAGHVERGHGPFGKQGAQHRLHHLQTGFVHLGGRGGQVGGGIGPIRQFEAVEPVALMNLRQQVGRCCRGELLRRARLTA
jgi:hypothetical protein